MRTFFAKSLLIVALVVSATAAAPVAHAQTTDLSNLLNPQAPQQSFAPNQTLSPIEAAAGSSALQSTAANPVTSVDTATANVNAVANSPAAQAAAKTPADNKVSDESMFNDLMQKILTLFAWLLGVAAMTLDNSVYYTVVNMGGYLRDLTAIGVTWRILRDIGNILLIFGFLAIGVSVILDSERLGYGKKMLPMLLVAAVFINFSLFMTEAVVDVGNLFATQFYQQINGGQMAGAKNFDANSRYGANDGIANKLMNQMGFQTIYGKALDKSIVLKGTAPWYIGFMGVLLFIVTAFVMFSLAFILVGRFVALIFLIVVAPVGFAGLAVPQLASMSKKWRDSLVEQTITAPVLLLLLYIALAVITDVNFLGGLGVRATPDWAGFVDNTNLNGFGSMLVSFLVAMGLLVSVVIFAKKLGAAGAGMATKYAGAATFGLTALGARSTVGLGSQYVAKKIRKSSLGDTKFGRVAATTFDKGAKATFDVRGSKAFQNIPLGGVDAGKPAEGGYKGRVKRSVEAHEEYAKSLTGRAETYGEKESVKAAAGNVAGALKEHEKAVQEHKTFTEEHEKQKAEVERLTAIDKTNRDEGKTFTEEGKQTTKDLKIVKDKLAASDALAPKVTETLTKTMKDLDTRKGEYEKIKEEVKEATSAKVQKEAYAKNIDKGLLDNPVGWALFGPGGSEAAEKIKKGKTKDQELLDKIKEFTKEHEEKPKKRDEKHVHVAAPEAGPVVHPAPPGGHDDHGGGHH